MNTSLTTNTVKLTTVPNKRNFATIEEYNLAMSKYLGISTNPQSVDECTEDEIWERCKMPKDLFKIPTLDETGIFEKLLAIKVSDLEVGQVIVFGVTSLSLDMQNDKEWFDKIAFVFEVIEIANVDGKSLIKVKEHVQFETLPERLHDQGGLLWNNNEGWLVKPFIARGAGLRISLFEYKSTESATTSDIQELYLVSSMRVLEQLLRKEGRLEKKN
jgi:hypothetical protein